MAAAAILATATAGAFGVRLAEQGKFTAPFQASVGGPFSMTAQDGRRLTDKDLRGKPFAIFFGFTQCPDVCPTTMLEIANLMQRLGSDADRMRFLFVTLDPERDTPDLLRDYLSSFDKRIIGLRGTPEETEAIVRAYRVFYEKVPTKSGYAVNHTATTFLMDAEGRFAKTMAFGEDESARLKKLQDLIGASAPSG